MAKKFHCIKIPINFTNRFLQLKLTIKTSLIHIHNWLRRLSDRLATHIEKQNQNQHQHKNNKQKHVTNKKLNHENN